MRSAGQTPAKARYGLVLLHGRGAGARDIIGLGEALALPDVAFIAPEAPGKSWWPTSFLAPTEEMSSFVHDGIKEIDTALSSFASAGLPRHRIGLLGFSQGACLTAEYLARAGAGLGFGFILSGGLVGLADKGVSDPALYGFRDKALDYTTDLSDTEVYLSCHDQDPHIPHKRFCDSVATLLELGATVSDRTKSGVGHGIDEEDVSALRRALNVPPG